MVAKVIELPDELQRRNEELSRQMGRDDADLVRDALTTFVNLHDVPQPTSDGTIDDPDLAARDIDDWLAANWRIASVVRNPRLKPGAKPTKPLRG